MLAADSLAADVELLAGGIANRAFNSRSSGSMAAKRSACSAGRSFSSTKRKPNT
jgi:hypothetical protein